MKINTVFSVILIIFAQVSRKNNPENLLKLPLEFMFIKAQIVFQSKATFFVIYNFRNLSYPAQFPHLLHSSAEFSAKCEMFHTQGKATNVHIAQFFHSAGTPRRNVCQS